MSFGAARFMKRIVVGMVPSALAVCLATMPCLANEWREAVDQSPQQIGPGEWEFIVDLGAKPRGPQFIGSQYDFDGATQGITVDYDYNGSGIDFSDDREFLGIAPTLFNLVDGFIHGWELVDLKDGVFSGVVYSTVPLTEVRLLVLADSFVQIHRKRQR